MRGSNVCQAHQLFGFLTAFGQSKHVAKNSARMVNTCCWQKIWALLDFYSFSTANLYRSVWIYLQCYARKGFALKDCAQHSILVIKAYIESKIRLLLGHTSFQVFGAALEKIAVALSRYAMIHGQVDTYDWAKLPQPKERPSVCLSEPWTKANPQSLSPQSCL